MSHPPIRTYCPACPTQSDRLRAAKLAEQLRREQPALTGGVDFSHLYARSLEPGPVLHLDDFSDISFPEARGTLEFLEDRCRLRAGEGDLIATRITPADGYESYCRQRLGLGAVRWLQTGASDSHRHLAAACWIDPAMRRNLARADFRYVHPHMGSFAVWALADLLARSTGRRIEVIAPPPALSKKTNDKLWVADVVARLLGQERIPRTRAVSNFSTLAWAVRELSADSKRLVVKLIDSVGGGGNLVLEAARFRGLPLGQVRLQLKSAMAPFGWHGETSLLVGCWETEVLSAPSAQMWIPPLEMGEPICEGLFDQVIRAREGLFVGTRPAHLRKDLAQEIIDACWLIATVFQHLGYVGRCSFDLILVGHDLDNCKVEFVECNARWGGTSLPMTLLNRLLGDWSQRSFSCLDCSLEDADRAVQEADSASSPLTFSAIANQLDDKLFDVRTGSGDFILINPGALVHREIGLLGFGERYFDDPSRLQSALNAGLHPIHARPHESQSSEQPHQRIPSLQ
jgi:hypothetical protein